MKVRLCEARSNPEKLLLLIPDCFIVRSSLFAMTLYFSNQVNARF